MLVTLIIHVALNLFTARSRQKASEQQSLKNFEMSQIDVVDSDDLDDLETGRNLTEEEVAELVCLFGLQVGEQQHRISHRGIAEARSQTVAACTFEKFPDLPVEIQHHIWSLASCNQNPQIHAIRSMEAEHNAFKRRSIYTLQGSSRVQRKLGNWRLPDQIPPVSTLFHICRDSRIAAQKVLTRLSSCLLDEPKSATYFNTHCDSFYMGGDPWHSFKILVDILIKLNTTRPLQLAAQRDVDGLQNIRFMIVDFCIFAEAPKHLWAEFPKLECLTIAFHGTVEISPERLPGQDRFLFVKPQRGTRLRKRADWIVKSATESLQGLEAYRNEVTKWEPKVQARVRATGFKNWDCAIKYQEYDDEGQEIGDEQKRDKGEQPIWQAGSQWEARSERIIWQAEEDDSNWYVEAAKMMAHTVGLQQIQRLEHAYHPSHTTNGRAFAWTNVTEWDIEPRGGWF